MPDDRRADTPKADSQYGNRTSNSATLALTLLPFSTQQSKNKVFLLGNNGHSSSTFLSIISYFYPNKRTYTKRIKYHSEGALVIPLPHSPRQPPRSHLKRRVKGIKVNLLQTLKIQRRWNLEQPRLVSIACHPPRKNTGSYLPPKERQVLHSPELSPLPL